MALTRKKLLASGGSLIVTVPLSRRDTITLTDAFLKGKLRRFGVTSIKIDETANESGLDQTQVDAAADKLSATLATPAELDRHNSTLEFP